MANQTMMVKVHIDETVEVDQDDTVENLQFEIITLKNKIF